MIIGFFLIISVMLNLLKGQILSIIIIIAPFSKLKYLSKLHSNGIIITENRCEVITPI